MSFKKFLEIMSIFDLEFPLYEKAQGIIEKNPDSQIELYAND